MLTRRTLLASTLALAACGKQTTQPAADLRVATYRGNVETWMAAAGLPAFPFPLKKAQFASGNLITEAISAGAIDLGSMSDIPPVFIARQNSPVRLVAVLEGDVANQVVLVPKNSPIKSTAQLKGKRIGYVRATTSHYILLRILDEHGLTFADITPVALAPQDGRAAFERGDLDAWVIFGAIGFLAREATGARILTNGKGRLSGNYVFAAAQSALDDPSKRTAVAAYLRRVRDTFAWTETHPDETFRLAAAATGLPESLYRGQRAERTTAPNLIPPSDAAIATQQQVADTFFRAGAIPAKVDVAPLWVHDFDYRTA
ncbi:ABC transporter substrate-binding protein [Polymorphobacter glacialis]|uniref:Putative aliphatic sulfonates-binding protein n=1 Tax=Sandarakinorhabdus glacialis TaxID=1614636 RepID=A0A916ZU19_9SPHN|nr:ABC transporter substrate-binding protein [Polymorphobacter glacialis]GGE14222.1 ABC transporter substrate-binding protein [Polymorphobacter glacialis]